MHLIHAFYYLMYLDVLPLETPETRPDQTRRKRCIWEQTKSRLTYYVLPATCLVISLDAKNSWLCSCLWHGLIIIEALFLSVIMPSHSHQSRKCFAPLVWKLTSDTKTIPLKLMEFLRCFNHLLSSENRAWWSLCPCFFFVRSKLIVGFSVHEIPHSHADCFMLHSIIAWMCI